MPRIAIARATRVVLALPLTLAASGPAQAGPSAYRVKDINPGAGGSTRRQLTDVNGTLFFVPADGELWKSDGTELGTVRVKDIRPGGLGSDPRSLVNFNGVLFFSANDGVNGYELWRSDGTTSGTVMVKDINPGVGSSIFGTWKAVLNGCCSSPPTMASTASSCGRATAPAPAP